jgi:restriction endonuclease Mrr
MIQFIPYILMGLGGMYGITYHLLRVHHNDKMILSMKKLLLSPNAIQQPKVQEYLQRLIDNTH